MRPKLVIIYLAIIILPLAVLGFFANRIASNEKKLINERVSNILTGRLLDISSGIDKFIKLKERQFLKISEGLKSENPAEFYAITGKNSLIRQIFVREKSGKISFPRLNSYSEMQTNKFFIRTKSIWDSGVRFYHSESDQAKSNNLYGWHSWFWNEGINFIFWKRLDNEKIFGIEINRAAFIAELIGQLPETGQFKKKLPRSRIVLTSAQNRIIYQWGEYQPGPDRKVSAKLALSAPLEAWNLQFFVPLNGEIDHSGSSTFFSLVIGLLTFGIALALLAFYFYRENNREISEAIQKVSFVNKVSHELKTPLTNIRMYAEFLEKSVDEKDRKSQKYANIVIAESRRLSRLINNVLTFAKKQRGNLVLQMKNGIPALTIESVVDSFKPVLGEKGIKIHLENSIKREVCYDEDALKQIVGNLISNVEKYAFQGKYLKIESKLQKNKIIIAVKDKGPGISKENLKKIFNPFVRISEKLSDGVTGTGIGLTIARELARLHGGDLHVESDKKGSTFVVELKVKFKGSEPF